MATMIFSSVAFAEKINCAYVTLPATCMAVVETRHSLDSEQPVGNAGAKVMALAIYHQVDIDDAIGDYTISYFMKGGKKLTCSFSLAEEISYFDEKGERVKLSPIGEITLRNYCESKAVSILADTRIIPQG